MVMADKGTRWKSSEIGMGEVLTSEAEVAGSGIGAET